MSNEPRTQAGPTMNTKALDFMSKVDSAAHPYSETLDKQWCTEIKVFFPIEALATPGSLAPGQ